MLRVRFVHHIYTQDNKYFMHPYAQVAQPFNNRRTHALNFKLNNHLINFVSNVICACCTHTQAHLSTDRLRYVWWSVHTMQYYKYATCAIYDNTHTTHVRAKETKQCNKNVVKQNYHFHYWILSKLYKAYWSYPYIGKYICRFRPELFFLSSNNLTT